MTPTTSLTTANPLRTTLAALRAGARCEIQGPGCRDSATRLVGAAHTCSACASR